MRKRENSGQYPDNELQLPGPGYFDQGPAAPEIWATGALERSDTEYWSLLGAMSVEGAKFANYFTDFAAARGYKQLENHMSLAFEIPRDPPRFGSPAFTSQYVWEISQLGSGWKFGTTRPLAHPDLGRYDSVTLALTGQGDLALSCKASFAPRKYQRRVKHPTISILDDYEKRWYPQAVLKLSNRDSVLAQYFVSSENAETARKRTKVLNAWKDKLSTMRKHHVEWMESDLKRMPFEA